MTGVLHIDPPNTPLGRDSAKAISQALGLAMTLLLPWKKFILTTCELLLGGIGGLGGK